LPARRLNVVTAGLAFFLVLYLGFTQTLSANNSANFQQKFLSQSENQITPFVGQNINSDINGNQTHSHKFSLVKDQYFHLEFLINGLNARVILKAHDTGTISEVLAVESVSTPIIFIVKTSGIYTLTIHSQNEGEDGYYELIVKDIRQSQQSDIVRKRAEEVSFQGKLSIQRWTFESFQNAIKSFKEAIQLWKSIGDKFAETNAILDICDAYLLTNQTAKAVQNYNITLTTSRYLKSVRQETISRVGLCKAYNTTGEYQKGLEHCKQGVQLAETSTDRYLQAISLDSLGQTQWYMDNPSIAADCYKKALEIWRRIKNRFGEAETLLNLSYLEFQFGETEKAQLTANTALQLYRTKKNPLGESLVLIALGHFASRLGEKQKALEYYEQSLKLSRSVKELKGEAGALIGIAWVYEGFGEIDKAFNYNNQALNIFRKLDHKSMQAYLLMNIGQYFSLNKDYSNALKYLHLALNISVENKYSFFESLTLQALGNAYKPINKERSLEFYKLALLRVRGTDFYAESRILSDLGAIYQELGKMHFNEAQDYFQTALESHRKIKDISNESLTLYRFARLERERGNLDKAKEYIEASLNLSDALRSQFTNQDFRSLYSASAHDLHELYIDVLMRLNKERPDAGFSIAAFEASERGRARTFLEMLAESKIVVGADVDSALLEKEKELQKQLREKTEKQIKLLSSKHNAEDANALAKEIENTLNQYKEIQNKIRLSNPRYASLTQPRPLALKEIQQQLLDDDTQLVEFSLGEDRSFLWVVSKTSIESFELPEREVIETSVKRTLGLLIESSEQSRTLRNSKGNSSSLIASQPKYETEALGLSEMLFAKAQSSINAKRLLIMGDGALQSFPFAVLPSPKSEVSSPKSENEISNSSLITHHSSLLIEAHEIINLPSASALAVLRQEERKNQSQKKSVAIFADPVFSKDDERFQTNSIAVNKSTNQRTTRRSNAETLRTLYELARASNSKTVMKRSGFNLPRLPYSKGEAEAVAGMLSSEDIFIALGFNANLKAATNKELANYKIIHFATHGILNNEQPELSGIVFSLFNKHGENQNYFLNLQEIYNLRLPVELVVLSACQTGLGKELKGEGIVGLTRGFMYAGAKRVVASLWKVDDVATAELMKRFYKKLLQEKLSPSAALRVAQLEMSQQKRWKDPYYWAGFIIQGDWR